MTVEYRDETPFTGDNHTPAELADAIRTKKYGKDVREAIAQGIEESANVASQNGNLKFYFSNGNLPKMDFSTKKISIPAGSVHGLRSSGVPFASQELIATDNIGWLAFDVVGKTFALSNNSDGGYAIVGVYDASNGVFELFNGGNSKESITAPMLHGGAKKLIFFFGNPGYANFDLVTKKLIVPAGSFSTSNSNGVETFAAHEVSLTGGISWLGFNLTSKTFVVTNQPRQDVAIVGYYNDTKPEQCAIFDGLYSVGNVLPSVNASVGVLFTSGEININPYLKTMTLSGNFQLNLGNTIYNWSQNETLSIAGSNFVLFDITAKKITIGGVVNSGNSFVRLGYFLYDGKYLQLPTKNIRYGSKMLIIGNSITAGVNSGFSVTKYIENGLSRLGLAVDITNNSVGGTAVSNGKWYTDQNYIDRIENQTGTFGNILIHLGENEFNGSREIGTPESQDTNTMCGGLNSLITTLRSEHTKGQIFISTPAYAYFEGQNWRTKVNSVGKKLDDYIEAFAEVARLRGCIWIDNRNVGFVPHEIANQSVDGLHPNAVGAKMIAGNILRTISGFVATDFGIDDDTAHHDDSVIS